LSRLRLEELGAVIGCCQDPVREPVSGLENNPISVDRKVAAELRDDAATQRAHVIPVVRSVNSRVGIGIIRGLSQLEQGGDHGKDHAAEAILDGVQFPYFEHA
jgi:hypothetical protein